MLFYNDFLPAHAFGCAVTALLVLLHIILTWSISWVTKGNTLNKNLLKLQANDDLTFVQKYVPPTVMFLMGVAMSWINAPIVAWNIIVLLLNTLRGLLTETPEQIKALRFPLKNNPKMRAEAVWARLAALLVESGDAPMHKHGVIDSLNEASENVPSFNQIDALSHLSNLNIYSADVISDAIGLIKESD